MKPISISQYEFDTTLGRFLSLNPAYKWGGNVHGSFHDAIEDGSLLVDSVGMVRAFYEMATDKVITDIPNVHLMAGKTDYIPLRDACPGDLVFGSDAVRLFIDSTSQLACYSDSRSVVVDYRGLHPSVDEVHRGFVRVSSNPAALL